MPADALATLGASASAGMVLTPKAGIFHLQHQKADDVLTLRRDRVSVGIRSTLFPWNIPVPDRYKKIWVTQWPLAFTKFCNSFSGHFAEQFFSIYVRFLSSSQASDKWNVSNGFGVGLVPIRHWASTGIPDSTWAKSNQDLWHHIM